LGGLGQFELAIEWFNRTLELKPGHPAALSNRAIVLFQTGQRDKALEDFRMALAKSKDPGIFIARACCYLSEGNAGEAWYDVNEALHLSPGSTELLELSGEIEWERGNHQAAIENFTNAIKADPKRSSCYFKRSKILVQHRRFYEAISDLYRVIETDPFNREAKALLLNTYSQIDRENLTSMATK
jgi:tetratricopeptide (TPR) repeat protein